MQSFTVNDLTKRVEFEFELDGEKHTLFYSEPSHKKSKEFRKARRRYENLEKKQTSGDVLTDDELDLMDKYDDEITGFGRLSFTDTKDGEIVEKMVDTLGTNAIVKLMSKFDEQIDKALAENNGTTAETDN